ncbi:zinc metalloprotease [Nocardioides pocheonensis]|uniref:Zinc metalloprotease n=1 Tax=Nocardioides pocheonensis TaxID=661485 RepID=A0A3N0GMP8_9ACTN|nr:zinc metalloprotease [Nocardioides pocheonensis]RNM13669.1 zinc metalloprotease [Nocardioides pocheonensis]
MTTARRLSVGLVGLALAALASLASTPAHASTAGATVRSAAGTPCLHPTSRPTPWREAADTVPVSDRTRTRVASALRAETRITAAAARRAEASLDPSSRARAAATGPIVVPVYIHLIHGRRHGERRIGRRAARQMFWTLNGGYAGTQDLGMAPTGVSFRLKKITVSRNERWFHARPYSAADKQMKRRLHRGKPRVLNIYVNRTAVPGQVLLGFSTFPWQRAWRRGLDGVTVSDASLPGGRADGYNHGDTVIHETGHWLGLLHTFEGGCVGGTGGDGVADTPAEAAPSFRCDDRNTCTIPEYQNPADPTGPLIDLPDPIHNFLDYSYDDCMYQFTPGQSARMLAAYRYYRSGR